VIFTLIAMAYHVKIDGWDPRGWKRNQSPETSLTSDPPRSVAPRARPAAGVNAAADGVPVVVGMLWHRAIVIGSRLKPYWDPVWNWVK
jgi:hypothetical protein